jgi:hypothetical protein
MRDLVDGLMVGIVMLRGLCYWLFNTKSFKHLALDLTFGKNGTMFREKFWCGAPGGVFFTSVS